MILRKWGKTFLENQLATRDSDVKLAGTEYNIREGNGTPLQYSCLENPMDGGAWWAAVHGVAKSRTRLSNYFTLLYFR